VSGGGVAARGQLRHLAGVVAPGDTAGFPRVMLLDRDLRILDPEVPASDAAILEAIEAAL